MTIRLPDIELEYDPKDPVGRINAVASAIDTLDRHLRLAFRLSKSRSEGMYAITAQCFEQMQQILIHLKQVKDKSQRKEFRRRLIRIEVAISHLRRSGPRIQGSGALRVRRSTGAVRSISSGGLPSLGKRR